jgi:hypothetical protein
MPVPDTKHDDHIVAPWGKLCAGGVLGGAGSTIGELRNGAPP